MGKTEDLMERVQLLSEEIEDLTEKNNDLTEELDQMRAIYINSIDYASTLENELEKKIEILTNKNTSYIHTEEDHDKDLRVRLSIELSKNEHLEKINKNLMDQIDKFRLLYVNISAHSTALENELDEKYEEVKRLSITDPLTGVFNRSGFYKNIESELELMGRKELPLSLIMMDIDNFKDFNDSFGHDTGDEALIKVVNITQQSIRKSDIVTRWGGEEFIIIVPELHLSNAIELAERIRKNIEENLTLRNRKITCSFGVSAYHRSESIEDCIKRADNALYEAKEYGKNRVRGAING